MDNENNREQTQETQNSTDRQDWLSEELKTSFAGERTAHTAESERHASDVC